MHRLLVIQSGFLGDAVLASGMVRGLAAVYPGAEIGLLMRAEFAAIFRGLPGLARLHGLDKKRTGATRAMIAELRAAGYTAALVPHRSSRSALMAWRAGIEHRIGFRQSDLPLLLTDRVEYDITRHEIHRNAMLMERLGTPVPRDCRAPLLVPDPETLHAMRVRFAGREGPVLLAPGSVWPTKRWGTEGFTGLAKRLQAEGHRVVLLGSGAERALCEEIARGAGLPDEDVTAGRLSLVELVAVIALASRLVTNDSAPLHIAESLGTPVTAVFGPTVPEFGFGPNASHSRVVERPELPCRPCGIHGARRCPIGTHECMLGISAEDVLRASGITG